MNLRAKNYQSHRDTFLEFVKGVNVIFGVSLHGKTALARAIYLLANNRPLGAKSYSNFAADEGKTEIELKASGIPLIIMERTVQRKADKSKKLIDTTYKMGDLEFSSVEKSVPDQIKAALNLTELNIQKQFDTPFMIFASPGEVARTINRVTKLDQVDEWVSDYKKKINKAKNEVEVWEADLKQYEIELAKYKGFETLETEFEQLQGACAELDILQREFDSLDKLLAKMENIQDNLAKIKPALSIEEDIKKIAELEIEITSTQRQLTLTQKAKAIDEKIKGMQSIVSDLQELEKILEAEAEVNLLKSYIGRIEYINKLIDNSNAEYNISKEAYLKMLKGTKTCPIFSLPCPVVKEMTEKVEKGLQ